jgi:UDP-N-acetylglucosamine 1-carboxyvinyltransferase
MVWEKFGCTVEEKADHIAISGKLKGSRIDFPISTVGGTENALLCASVAAGDTEIHNAYVTPEVENLIDLLRLMGVEISMAGMSKIRVRGGQHLRGASIEVIPDRIEAITWMVWAAISGGDITVHRVPFSLMEIPLIHLRKAGIDFLASSDAVSISPVCLQGGAIQPFEVACGAHPGVISDMQPFYVLLGLHAEGRSKVYDYRYPERTAYVGELSKLYPGALQWTKGEVTTSGPVTPQGAEVTSTDLRGSMALLMAATVASGESSVDKVFMALRGYDRLLDKMNALGLSVPECPGT